MKTDSNESHRGGRILIALLSFFAFSSPGPAGASDSLLEGLEYQETESASRFRIRFSVPIRILRHSPVRQGRSIEVVLETLAPVDLPELGAGEAEILKPPRTAKKLLDEIRLELAGNGERLLLLKFLREVDFHIKEGSEFRSLDFDVARDVARDVEKSLAGPEKIPDALSIDKIMLEARRAMVARQYDRAISLYTLVSNDPAKKPEDVMREALEYLGLARQRKGQIAHATAEYENYLKRFPEGVGSDRVRQRLAALTTADSAAPEKLKKSSPRIPRKFDLFGSLYSNYSRNETFADLSGAELIDSSQYIDADLGIRIRRDDLELRARASGNLRYDYNAEESEVPSRVTQFYLEARDRRHHLAATLGRQSGKGSGVLGRLDGLTGSYTFKPGWNLKGVAGFPILSSVSNKIQTDQQVYGLSVETNQLAKGLSAELYTVAQFVDGITDRMALGIEARYQDISRTGFIVLDFDFHFSEINIAMFSGSWKIREATTFNAVFDYRFSPILTTRNALNGQPFRNLEELEDNFSSAEIEDLARDRTPRVTTLVAGVSHRMDENLEISGNLTASEVGGTSSSGGVPGYRSSGWSFSYNAQIVRWNWLVDGGSERLSLRFFDSERYNTIRAILMGRYPLANGFRLTPELQIEYRDNRNSQNFIELDPGLRFEYRFRRLVLDVDFLFQWIKGVGKPGMFGRRDERGYLLNIGARYDF
jgi:hypothetical protein